MTHFSDHDAVFIWGYGREGRAVLSLALGTAPGLPLVVVDAREPQDLPDGVTWIGEDELARACGKADRPLIVKSPGVSLYDPRLDAALKAGATLTSQTNLFFELKPKAQRVVAITGTKGKSTTSALTHHMLLGLGVKAALAGNIGDPALLAPKDAALIVLELSSYQIADLVHAPDAFIFLNLLADHAPWHKGAERYRADKSRLARLDPNAPGVMNAGDPRLIEQFGAQPNRIWFGREDGFHARDGAVWRGEARWGRIGVLPGDHNALNACAGLALIEALGYDARAAFETLSDFNGLPHRLQTVHEAHGVRYVDDGLATTPEAAAFAVDAFKASPLVLLLGGEDREQDYAWLADRLADAAHIRAILALADNGARVVEAFRDTPLGHVTRSVPDVADAVGEARNALPDGGVVLLSPAAPRAKAFESYVERGAAFTAAAKAQG
ncbi:UDP-N-acetylmuramoyl-L-alanine--D-glutamate ligase [Maricaulaceae bacterium MS644]